MTPTKWTTLAAALVVVASVGGGVRVAARQEGTRATRVPNPASPREDEGRPARKAFEEVQSWIARSEAQLVAGRDEIAEQKRKIRELNDRIKALEVKVKPATAASIQPLQASASDNPAEARGGQKPPLVDRIMTSETALASISGSNDRVVIYGTVAHRSRIYRLPHDIDVQVSFHGDDVIIVANGPQGTHLAGYNLKTDHWALQDLRGGTEGRVHVQGSNTGIKDLLLPCVLTGSGFTQVAAYNVARGCWSIQNLLEPSDRSAVPYKHGQLAMYVLGRHVYAYSAETGTWDTLTLEEKLLPDSPEALQTGYPVLLNRQDMFAVSQRGRLHIFSANAGRWETVNPQD